MVKYFIYFFAVIVSVSELAGLSFMGAIVALCVRLWQENPNFTQDTLITNNLHIFLSSLGAVFLTGNGIILFRLLRNYKTSAIKHIHAFVLGLTVLITIWGAWSGYKGVTYSAPNRVHFKNIHSILGIISVVFLILQYIVGVFIYLTDVVSFEVTESYNGLHGFLGVSTLIFNAITGVVGISMKANDPINFDLVNRGEKFVEASYEKFTMEYRVMFTAAFFMTLFAWNFFYITVNPYFEWTMIERY